MGTYPTMDDWEERVATRRKQLGDMNEAEMLRRAGLNGSYLSNLRSRGVSPTIETMSKIAHALQWSLQELFADTSTGEICLPPLSEITGGEMWSPGPEKGQKFPLSILSEDLVSFEVMTDEYRAAGYQRGDVVAGPRSIGSHLDNIIGRDCIVETADGHRYFKVLQRGDRRGFFTLVSFDPRNAKANVPNVKLNWAAPIKLIVRS